MRTTKKITGRIRFQANLFIFEFCTVFAAVQTKNVQNAIRAQFCATRAQCQKVVQSITGPQIKT